MYKKILLILSSLLFLIVLDLFFYKYGVQRKILDTIFSYLPTNPYYLEEMQVNNIASTRKYEICPEDSPALKRDTAKYSKIKFVEKSIDGNDNLTSLWVQKVLKVKNFNINSVFKNNLHLYYFHGDFNNDKYTDALVFRKDEFDLFRKDENNQKKIQNVALLINNKGKLEEKKSFRNLELFCRHEQVLIADFDNDEDLDIYLSCSTDIGVKDKLFKIDFYEKKPQSYFLINNGKGEFIEKAFEAGVSIHNTSPFHRPEGGAVGDFNKDGWLDIIVASRLFINNKNNTFTDQREKYGLPIQFDEGLSLADVDNNGTTDVIYFQNTLGPIIYKRFNNKFEHAHCLVQPSPHNDSGMSVYDINMDGWIDIMNSWRPLENTRSFALLGSSKGFIAERAEWWEFPINKRASVKSKIEAALEAPSYFLFNDDLKIDLISTLDKGGQKIFINKSNITPLSIYIEMVDSNGLQNQQGRKIILRPENQKTIVYSKLVDAGNGYLNQSQYPVVFYSQFDETHNGEAFFSNNIVKFQAKPGDKLKIYKSGKIEKIK